MRNHSFGSIRQVGFLAQWYVAACSEPKIPMTPSNVSHIKNEKV
jgi:hypothetical protein